jgi:hypothetical protein
MNSFNEERDTAEYDSLMSLADLIVIRLPGCDDELIRKFISLTYRDFVKRSCVLKSEQTIELENGRISYHLCSQIIGCDVDCIVGVSINGYKISAAEYAHVNDSINVNPRLLPNKGEKREMVVECLEVPRLGEERAPSWFIRKYGDAIVSGVLMNLMRMSGKAWSDPQQAAVEAIAYENALTENRMRYYGNDCGDANYFKGGLVL